MDFDAILHRLSILIHHRWGHQTAPGSLDNRGGNSA